jgi:quercetin dioxygenase-like cupin family protein
MQKTSLAALARQEKDKARSATAGRSASTVFGGHEKTLRQTLLTLRADATLDEHENPGEATLLVLSGRVRLDAGDTSWEARDDDLLVVPDTRHSLVALEDSVVLLTVAKKP